eukprot:736582-Amphidinium_carterae.2
MATGVERDGMRNRRAHSLGRCKRSKMPSLVLHSPPQCKVRVHRRATDAQAKRDLSHNALQRIQPTERHELRRYVVSNVLGLNAGTLTITIWRPQPCPVHAQKSRGRQQELARGLNKTRQKHWQKCNAP